MKIEDLRKAHQAIPFRPFTICLADGRAFFVPRRECLSQSPTGGTIIVYDASGAFDILDFLLVTDLKEFEMENIMTIEQLRKVHKAVPFVPFTIYLADGRSHAVPHPECMMFSQSGRTVVLASPDGTFDIIDLLLVTDLKVHAPAPA